MSFVAEDTPVDKYFTSMNDYVGIHMIWEGFYV